MNGTRQGRKSQYQFQGHEETYSLFQASWFTNRNCWSWMVMSLAYIRCRITSREKVEFTFLLGQGRYSIDRDHFRITIGIKVVTYVNQASVSGF